ncbi:50S ribosomal protein L6 [Candidatus Berkelbacteria bacterium CG_4_8_14_3_um_filter_33_6]|uniref:Large ribosomal subunit protein uL6 n=1 Tax=Candidatus Berkelbacteria bacterium CG_4_10_14_0_2_um_filter_35_9_33_12 TaxID=1974499 RepID=A0A2M7W5F4_9BACT|nr:MAG: 50S ribosomal protein L6 [Candidatus Berkelbacteria bacterium CG23_combo_of_CG06-09_8_20_14_all_33_15]PIS08119.1 MAG: 50S ribosomal protein L6 [Candidatus Berkelbacteria bacterium CG10_big_fil_rev_8_21_14_0_10_33_10]PIX31289.1 MAG: 50S ribosomal protein L6 [Candidatus Berkelbacteria bacterium CG_4_8_14_3_um_filter_33_6]PIZ28180.1 MAG: 50S ribosomal protein L6 [Candidatus Berkelbacteria bacterium CG_4_10_14_0_8_um_filter_35_9_33_8]PJA20764.1 MAG: 50S ribosomal protein L6 [Candidatus Berk
MSKIGKKIIIVPEDVKVIYDDKLNHLKIVGPKGELEVKMKSRIIFSIKDNIIKLDRKNEQKNTKSLHGLYRSLIANAIVGVTTGYEKNLDVIGIGYRVSLENDKLILNVGFSHVVEIVTPEGIDLKVEKNSIKVSGIDKQLVGNFAANIRKIRPPEPYKGKGIRYLDEIIKLKPGKSLKAEK